MSKSLPRILFALAMASLLSVGCSSEDLVPPSRDGGTDGSSKDFVNTEASSSPSDAVPEGKVSSDQGPKKDALRDGHSADKKTSDAKPDAYLCTPSAFLSCKTSSLLLQCSSTGAGTVLVDCSPYLCDSTSKRCTQCDPKTAAYCQNNDAISCTVEGLLIKVTCPVSCLNGSCTSCTMKAYYQDADGDGYGNPGVKVNSCAQPNNFVANNLDCDDQDPAAHPGQVAYFNVPTKGTHTYDYNCDGLEEKEDPSLVTCIYSGTSCSGSGWVGTIPSCGTTGTWAKCNKQGSGSTCGTTTTSKIQSCH